MAEENQIPISEIINRKNEIATRTQINRATIDDLNNSRFENEADVKKTVMLPMIPSDKQFAELLNKDFKLGNIKREELEFLLMTYRLAFTCHGKKLTNCGEFFENYLLGYLNLSCSVDMEGVKEILGNRKSSKLQFQENITKGGVLNQ